MTLEYSTHGKAAACNHNQERGALAAQKAQLHLLRQTQPALLTTGSPRPWLCGADRLQTVLLFKIHTQSRQHPSQEPLFGLLFNYSVPLLGCSAVDCILRSSSSSYCSFFSPGRSLVSVQMKMAQRWDLSEEDSWKETAARFPLPASLGQAEAGSAGFLGGTTLAVERPGMMGRAGVSGQRPSVPVNRFALCKTGRCHRN